MSAPDAPAVEPKRWDKGVAPAYIALFLGIVYLDALAPRPLAIGGLGPALIGAATAGLACYLLLYYAPALWGLRSGRPIVEVARSTFGARGAAWLPGVLIGLGQVIWFAVAIWYATDLTFRCLVSYGLLGPQVMRPWTPRGVRLMGRLFLAVAAIWSLFAAAIGPLTMRLVAAVMAGYVAFPALALGAATLWALPGLPGFRPAGLDPATGAAVRDGAAAASLLMVQMILGFFAAHGVLAADWGAASRSERDVRLGGLVGVAGGATILAILALLITAGALGRSPPRTEAPVPFAARAPRPRPVVLVPAVEDQSLKAILSDRLGGVAGGTALMLFGLGMLGPACYAPTLAGRRLHDAVPRLRPWAWSLASAFATWPLIAFGWAGRLDLVFGVMGAAFAPVVGALTADFVRCRGRWPGPRPGVNLAGGLAWLVGLLVGLLPWIGPAAGLGAWSRAQPAVAFAYGAAFLAYLLLAAIGLEPRPSP